MNLLEKIRSMDKRLRVMLIAASLLIVPQTGQFLAISDINHSGRESNLAIFFLFTAIFIVPTSLILTTAILAGIRRQLRAHIFYVILGTLNILIALNIAWFFFSQCTWSNVLRVAIAACTK